MTEGGTDSPSPLDSAVGNLVGMFAFYSNPKSKALHNIEQDKSGTDRNKVDNSVRGQEKPDSIGETKRSALADAHPTPDRCDGCSASLYSNANFCHRCGFKTPLVLSETSSDPPASAPHSPPTENHTAPASSPTPSGDATVAKDLCIPYSAARRRLSIKRYLEKRKKRVWKKEVKYEVRKQFADQRRRVGGRFVKSVPPPPPPPPFPFVWNGIGAKFPLPPSAAVGQTLTGRVAGTGFGAGNLSPPRMQSPRPGFPSTAAPLQPRLLHPPVLHPPVLHPPAPQMHQYGPKYFLCGSPPTSHFFPTQNRRVNEPTMLMMPPTSPTFGDSSGMVSPRSVGSRVVDASFLHEYEAAGGMIGSRRLAAKLPRLHMMS